jgi:hypothetical protein
MTSPSAITSRRVRQNFQRIERPDLDHHLEGLAEQEIADQHACLVAPDHARGRLAAAHVAFVDDVVMQKRCRVHELDACRQLDVPFALVTKHVGGGERDHRTQPFATGGNQMVGDLGDHLHVGSCLRQDQFVDAVHPAGDQRHEIGDPCWLFLVFPKWNNDAHGNNS